MAPVRLSPRRAPWASRAPLNGPLGWVIGCAAYLLAAAALSVASVPHRVGLAVLLAIAASAGWRTSRLGAAGIGGVGWLFYSGFVTHAHGQLGITGITDAYTTLALVFTAVGASCLRAMVMPPRGPRRLGRGTIGATAERRSSFRSPGPTARSTTDRGPDHPAAGRPEHRPETLTRIPLRVRVRQRR